MNPGKYGMTSAGVESRRDFVRSVRQKIAAYRPGANNHSGAGQADKRAQLLGSSKDRVAQQAAQAALREENDDFIGGEQLKRALIEREQDEVLDDLGESVTRLGQMGASARPCACSLRCTNVSKRLRLLHYAVSSLALSRFEPADVLGGGDHRPVNPHGTEGTGRNTRRPGKPHRLCCAQHGPCQSPGAPPLKVTCVHKARAHARDPGG